MKWISLPQDETPSTHLIDLNNNKIELTIKIYRLSKIKIKIKKLLTCIEVYNKH